MKTIAGGKRLRAKSLHQQIRYNNAKKILYKYPARTLLHFMIEAMETKKWPVSKKLIKEINAYIKNMENRSPVLDNFE